MIKGLIAAIPLFLFAAADASIVSGFRDPPRDCALQCWWHWLDDCVTREGIVRDLRAMKDAGISTAHIFSTKMSNLKATARCMSPEWLDLFACAISEARECGVDLGFHNGPGWSSSGGPWIRPEDSMKRVVAASVDVALGSLEANSVIAVPAPPAKCGFYRDIETFAFPVTRFPAKVSGELPSTIPLRNNDRFEVFLKYETPFAPVMAVMEVATGSFYMKADVYARVGDEWERRGGKDFKCFREDESARIMALGPGAAASEWKIVFTATDAPPWVGRRDIPLRVLSLGNWPYWNGGRDAIAIKSLVRVGGVMRDGKIESQELRRMLPDEKSCMYRIVRIGYTSTGGGPAPATIGGLECDKLSSGGIDAHWKEMPARVLALPGARDVVKYVIIDSYEVGGQNWTEEMAKEFRKRAGYAIDWHLLSMVGYTVGSREETGRFLQDLRKVIGDLYAENYYDRFSVLCHKAGVKAITEPYGGPFDTVRCARDGDVPTAEFWLGRPVGESVRLLVQAARKYGKNIVAAESFTTDAAEGRWQATPAELRESGDAAWAAGINQLVMHSYVHQAFVDRKPGLSLGRHGSQLNVNTTWWPEMRWWTDYVRRGQFLLRYGRADRDHHELSDGRLEAISRMGGNGERIWFVRNKSEARFSGLVRLGATEDDHGCEFDAVTGELHPAEGQGALTRVELDRGKSAFYVYGIGWQGKPRRKIGKMKFDLSHGWRIEAFAGVNSPDGPIAADPLFSWDMQEDEKLRYFSGRARYVREGAFPEGVLDLGIVKDIANVSVDGKFVACLWQCPYRISIPAGRRLEVEVVNAWPNRLIGDAVRSRRGDIPYTWSNWTEGWSADAKLRAAGLLGPVVISHE